MPQRKSPGRSSSSKSAARRSAPPWIAGGVLAVAVVLGVWLTRPAAPTPPASTSANPPAPAREVSPDVLTGRWLRPDGGYVLEILSADASGKLDARYFNPQPINVGRAEWRREAGALKVFVELRDVNYPGSTYNLALSTDQARLSGLYHQAAIGQNFEVDFVRER